MTTLLKRIISFLTRLATEIGDALERAAYRVDDVTEVRMK